MVNWSKTDKVGFTIHNLLLIGFLISLIWLLYFAEEIMKYKDINFYIYILILLGILQLSSIYYNISEWIFYPETKSEKLLRKKKKEYKNTYPIKIARLKTQQLNIKLKLKDLRLESKDIDKKIKEDKK